MTALRGSLYGRHSNMAGREERWHMESKREALLLAGICGVVVLLSLAGVVWVFASQMGFTLDAIFMILVCLSMAGVFSLMLLLQLKAAGLLPSLKSAGTKRPPSSAKQSA